MTWFWLAVWQPCTHCAVDEQCANSSTGWNSNHTVFLMYAHMHPHTRLWLCTCASHAQISGISCAFLMHTRYQMRAREEKGFLSCKFWLLTPDFHVFNFNIHSLNQHLEISKVYRKSHLANLGKKHVGMLACLCSTTDCDIQSSVGKEPALIP